MITTTIVTAAMLFAGPQPQTVDLTFDRAELATQAGAARAYSRIRRTAKRNCKATVMTGHTFRARKSCEAGMVSEFVEALGVPQVTALHDATPRAGQRLAGRTD